MKATEQYFPVVLLCSVYKVILTLSPVEILMKSESVTIQMKATEHYVLVGHA